MTIQEALDLIARLAIPGYGEDEVGLFAETIDRWKPTHVFEWGTNRGSSARIFYELAELAGSPCEVHTVELPAALGHMSTEYPGGDHAFFVRDIETVHCHLGDGAMLALQLYKEIEPERALFFVDGDHRREAVARELEMIAPTVARERTVLLFHDAKHRDGREPTGPAMALDAFLADRSHDYDVTWLPSQAGLARLWPR